MNDGTHLTDRMVDVALGRADWTPPEAAHLHDCAECEAEWRLVVGAAAIGRSTVVDAERIAASVVERLAAARVRAPWARRSLWLAGLAAAAAIAIVALPPDPGRAPAPAPTTVPAVLSELDDLTSEELLTVLDVIDPVSSDAIPGLEVAPLGDLTTGELERVLRSLEG